MTLLAIFFIILGLLLLLSVVSIFLTSSAKTGEEAVNRGTRFFLVLLRLAIGWQFTVEGLDKLYDPSWTGEYYLRASTGPLSGHFREIADEEILAEVRLHASNHQTVAVLTSSTAGLMNPLTPAAPFSAAASLYPGRAASLPPALERKWQRYFDEFVEVFELEEQQKKRARIKLDQAKAQTLMWLMSEQRIDKLSPYVERPADMTVAERLEYYHELVDDINEIVAENVVPYGSAAEDKLKRARDEANYIITALKRDLAGQTENMKDAIRDAVPSEKSRYRLPEMPPPPMNDWTRLQWSDHVIPWGLCIVGGLLLAGLFTRTACVVGAAFLLLLYVTMMPLPGWPAPPQAEGHYVYVNKNLIEMFALLALATTRSGRWLGLDSLCPFLFRRRATANTTTTPPASTGGNSQSQPLEQHPSGKPYEINIPGKKEKPHGA